MPKAKVTSKFSVLGVMSGTSLDGLDLALTTFIEEQGQWHYVLDKATCIGYQPTLRRALEQSIEIDAAALCQLDKKLGRYIGEQIKEYFSGASIDFIASHGHTIFHQPQKGITLQIGCGHEIYKVTGIPVIYDFRNRDVQLGGQGAPLVPIGDELLFGDFAACLNLGGIANLSFRQKEQRVAFDLMPFNMALNSLAKEVGKAYDENGQLARTGCLNETLMRSLDAIPYYQKEIPKSLGIEDFQNNWFSLINHENISLEDRLHTYVLHAAKQIGHVFNQYLKEEDQVLVTGGGSYHTFFIESLKRTFHGSLSIPSSELIDYKEALIFAFMGLMKRLGKTNCLASVTGASSDSSAGKMVGF